MEPWFAWHPVMVQCCGIVWLRKVNRVWDESMNSWGDCSGYSGTDGGWKYYLKDDER